MTTDNQPCREWDYFCDISYYNLWAVRPMHETQWGENTFHLNSPEEAKALCELLNTRTPPISYDAAVEKVFRAISRIEVKNTHDRPKRPSYFLKALDLEIPKDDIEKIVKAALATMGIMEGEVS